MRREPRCTAETQACRASTACRGTTDTRGSATPHTRTSEATYPAYRPAPHHRQIAGRLEAVARGECKRLLIIMPPRHGKSELASRRFPLWYLGQNPHHEVIAASYGGELASLFGRTLRNVAQGSEHARIFPQALLGPRFSGSKPMAYSRWRKLSCCWGRWRYYGPRSQRPHHRRRRKGPRGSRIGANAGSHVGLVRERRLHPPDAWAPASSSSARAGTNSTSSAG